MEMTNPENSIKSVILNSNPIVFRFNNGSKKNMEILINALDKILNETRKSFMKAPLEYIVRECVYNADKSNYKRIHFTHMNLDIKNSDDYYTGIKSFANDYREKIDVYTKELENYKYYTEVEYLIKDNILSIIVKNNNLPISQEIAKVQKLLEKSKAIRDVAEAYMAVGDSSEGAGLGLITIILMLRSLGLDEKSFRFSIDRPRNETVTKIDIPLNSIAEMHLEELSDIIAKEIKFLPQFPEKLTELQKVLSSKEIDFSKVAGVIQSDILLTAELLKIVNSAQYMLPQKVGNIMNAISLIGIKGLKNLIYSYGVQNIMIKHYGQLDELWTHSYLCASYAYNIAKKYKMKDIMDDAYISGILHDIGKIIIYNSHPGLIGRINSFSKEKGIEGNIIENISLGSNHAKIGAMMAQKWNFPDNIVSAIGFHHQPQLSKDEHRIITSIAYLANMLTRAHRQDFSIMDIEKPVLEIFGIKSEIELKALIDELNDLYKLQSRKDKE